MVSMDSSFTTVACAVAAARLTSRAREWAVFGMVGFLSRPEQRLTNGSLADLAVRFLGRARGCAILLSMAGRSVFFLNTGGYEMAWNCTSLALTAAAMGE